MYHSDEDGFFGVVPYKNKFYAEMKKLVLIDGGRYEGVTYGTDLPPYFHSQHEAFMAFLGQAKERYVRFDNYQREKKRRIHREESIANVLGRIPVEDLERHLKTRKTK